MEDINNVPGTNSGPIQVFLEFNKAYGWCTCGKTGKGAFCDGAHKELATTNEEGALVFPFKALKFIAENEGEAWLCGCQKTKTPPYCDGSHKR